MVVAVTMVKDEADVIEHTVTRMLDQVDAVIVADNGSTDGTREILEGLPVDLKDEPDSAYYQSIRMTKLADQARHAGADWVLPFDADEVWLAEEGTVASTLRDLPDATQVVEAVLFEHVATADSGGDPIARMGWRRAAAMPLRKVACRALEGLRIDQGNHSAGIKDYPYPLTVTRGLEVRHFPYRSPEQFIRKIRNGAAAYAATDLDEDVGAHWRGHGRTLERQGPEALVEAFRECFWSNDPKADGLVFDPCP